jgi:O-antigen/teichoic acid export membrane protein
VRVSAPASAGTREGAADRPQGSAFWYVLSTATAAALPLLVLPFITRALEPADYGAWVLAHAYAVFATSLASVGLPIVYERSYFEAQAAGDSASLLWTTSAFVCGALAFGTALTWIFREVLAIALMPDRTDPDLVFWTTCAVAVSSVKTYFLLYFRNAGDARRHALFSVEEAVGGAAGSVLLVAWWQTGPLGLAWGPLAAATVVLAQVAAYFARHVPVRIAWRPLRRSLALSLPLLPRVALGVFGQVFDKWLVGLVAATGGVAAYAIGQRLAFAVFAFSTALENVFQPKTYRLMFEGSHAGTAIGRMLTPFAYATVGAALALGLAAEELVAVLAPESYGAAAAIATVLALHYALLFFGKQPQLLHAGKTGIVSAVSSTTVVVSAAAMWLLALRYGAFGAAAGTALAGAAMTWLFVVISQRYYRIRYERGQLSAMYLFLAAALLLVHLALRDLSYPALVGIKIALLMIYVGMGVKLGCWRALAHYAWPTRAAPART